MNIFPRAIILVFFFLSKFASSQAWSKITDFPSSERDDGCYFTIGHTTYCGTGLQVGYVLGRDFYSFDMTSETWDTISSLPSGMERQYAASFSYNNNGFVFGGIAGTTYLNDLWMYDAVTNKWQSKTSL